MQEDKPVYIEAFSYQQGLPSHLLESRAQCHVVDCRGLPNPWHRAGLCDLLGTDPRMLEYFMAEAPAKVEELMTQASEAIGKGYTCILFGCVHGRHRSVAMSAEFQRRLCTQQQKEQGNTPTPI